MGPQEGVGQKIVHAKVLAIANKKGGTGKSTMAVNLAAELGARGYRVLIADTDPQGHAGLGFGVGAPDESHSIHAAFREPRVDLTQMILATGEPRVDVLAADRSFDGQVRVSDPRCLAGALQRIKSMYDVVLIDTPPAAANIMVCALLASDGVLVPTALDYLALDGVRQFARAYHQVMLQLQATLLGLAIAPMLVDFRNNMQKVVLTRLQTGFGADQVLRGVRIDVSVAEAFAVCQPLRRHRIHSRAIEDFRVVADDVVRRFSLPGPSQASARVPCPASTTPAHRGNVSERRP
jgi:chromosome partitioning protein